MEDIKFRYKGKAYKLRNDALLFIQGVSLLVIGCACHKTKTDGAAVFMWLMSAFCLLPVVEKNILYRMAKSYVNLMENKEN